MGAINHTPNLVASTRRIGDRSSPDTSMEIARGGDNPHQMYADCRAPGGRTSLPRRRPRPRRLGPAPLHRDGLVDLDGPAAGQHWAALCLRRRITQRVGRHDRVAARAGLAPVGDTARTYRRRVTERVPHVGDRVAECAEPCPPGLHRLLLRRWRLCHLTADVDIHELRHRILLAPRRPAPATGIWT